MTKYIIKFYIKFYLKNPSLYFSMVYFLIFAMVGFLDLTIILPVIFLSVIGIGGLFEDDIRSGMMKQILLSGVNIEFLFFSKIFAFSIVYFIILLPLLLVISWNFYFIFVLLLFIFTSATIASFASITSFNDRGGLGIVISLPILFPIISISGLIISHDRIFGFNIYLLLSLLFIITVFTILLLIFSQVKIVKILFS